MSDVLHSEEYKGHTIEIVCDEDVESPREWDNLGTMAFFHKRYQLGDKLEHDSMESFQEWYECNISELISLPVYMYDHSGLAINTTGFHCPWDSGQLGVIFVTHETLKKEYPKGWNEADVIRQLEQEVTTYNSFLSCGGHGFVVTCNGEHIDSCYGFLDDTQYAISEAKGIVDHYCDKTAAWNRFDICEAFYMYAMLHHLGQFSDEYKIHGRLHNVRFKPAPSLSGPDQLSDNARVIYYGLVRGAIEVSPNH